MRLIDTSTLRPTDTHDSDTSSWIYNGLDCALTAEIFDTLHAQLDDSSAATYELKKAMQGPVLDMNLHGLPVDKGELLEAQAMLSNRMEELETSLNEILSEGYGVPSMNWRSPPQMLTFLYEYLQLPVIRHRKSNGTYGPTANRTALEKLSVYINAAPFINHVLMLRDLGKKLGFLQTSLDSDGHMRSSYNIAGTVTDRLASSYSDFGSGTNQQNIDRLLRRIFIAPPGYKLANLDLEQADSRNVGAMCWNKFYQSHGPEFAGSYLDACESGDLHTTVTRMSLPDLEWTGDPKADRAIADVIAYRDKTRRDFSKILGHGSNYVGKPPTMAKHSKLPVPLVEAFQTNYFAAFPCIPEGHLWTARELLEYSHLSTILGRRRYFWGNLKDEKTLRDAISFEGQGSTAGEINQGLVQLWRGRRQWPGFQLLTQVHDSVLFWFKEEQENEIIPWAIETLRVPITLVGGREFVVPTEAKTGWNWGDYNDQSIDSNGRKQRLNLDGLKKWKNGDSRNRQHLPRRGLFR